MEIDEQMPRVIADSTRLTQILLNLLSNAVKFTDPGGSINLAIHRAENGGVVLEVRDTGPGMNAAEIEIALQPFGQVAGGLARRHNGTGLGLPLARELAELHGGSLLVTSEKEHGTTVTVTLPATRVLADTAPSSVVGQAALNGRLRGASPAIVLLPNSRLLATPLDHARFVQLRDLPLLPW